jgi:ABC-type amino acid transport substrate-binding protein
MNLQRIIGLAALLTLTLTSVARAQDLADVKASGALRHLGVPYAHFVTGSETDPGLDVEVMQLFAKHLGVRYEYVKTDWKNVLGDLTGQTLESRPEGLVAVGTREAKGDLIANGLTVLPPRQKIVDYSNPTFPSAVWLVATSHSRVKPIKASGDMDKDIAATKMAMNKGSTLVMESTCLDPKLYDLKDKGYQLNYYTRSTNLNEMIPAVLNKDAEMTLLDVPDILVALSKWPGKFKVIGPVSREQRMGVAFRKDSPELRAAFNDFFAQIQKDGTYGKLVVKYYPLAPRFFPDFFKPAKKAKK